MAPPNRRMCNELVRELCLEIPIVNTSERILLTALNMHAYLEPRFSKMQSVYRDAIAFLKTVLNAKKHFVIRINQVAQNEESKPIVVTRQGQDEEGNIYFDLETNKFRVRIKTQFNNIFQDRTKIYIRGKDVLNAHLLYFLRLVAPLLQPIQLYYNLSLIPIEVLAHFMDTQSDWIDSIGLMSHHIDSELIYGTLKKYNKLQIYGLISPVNIPKIIHWLTSNNHNNGQPKKCLVLTQHKLDDGIALLADELKKEFARATSKSRFVIRLELLYRLMDEFILFNGMTGEKLQVRRKNYEDKRLIHILSRSPNNGLDENANDCTELDYWTEILFT